ncbi:unnamed protein product [Plutella xylostella]|uniref:(diamondback moth) hypothetical protein n=1 Tax=Plutella xylostella TaxID=51655 RepID=A0A8S4FJN4_PLUXY|nr:unnamed protein product [Plutella xylostella]
MTSELCRLCLSKERLSPIFTNASSSDKNSNILAMTTGLQININDGLPQHICSSCEELVNSSLNLRSQSQAAEQKLLAMGYRKLETHIGADSHTLSPDSISKVDDTTLGSFNTTLEIDSELDIKSLTDFVEEDKSIELQKNTTECNIKPKVEKECTVDITKSSRKERREAYLSLVEGQLNPKGPVTCKVCKKTVSSWPSFVSHAKLHLGFKFVCEYCGKSFVSSTQLNRHCRSHHGMERNLRCSSCDYLALDNTQLVLHERRVHTGERPFACASCGAAYHSRRCLLQHLESHQTSATVQCEKCPQMFKSRRHLARHTYSAHTSKQFTYKCPVCAHVYRNIKYIRVHLKKVHGLTTSDAKIIKIKL